MVFSKFKEVFSSNTDSVVGSLPTVLVVEDDIDQLNMLVEMVLGEAREIASQPDLTDKEKLSLRTINVVKITDAQSLSEAVNSLTNIILVVLDCNIPDTKSEQANDQFIMDNHRITGQHRSVDTIITHAPSAELVLISSMKRFQRTVLRFYKSKRGLQLKFVDKSDVVNIKASIKGGIFGFLEKQS